MKLDSTMMVAIALVAALGLLAVVVHDISISQQQAEAKSVNGQCASFLKNSSAQFCHNI